MPRLSCVVLTPLAADAPVAQSFRFAAQESNIAFDVVSGNFEEMLAVVGGWVILPEILVIDLPDEVDHIETLQRLGEVMPAGETSVVMVDVRNDIRIYRQLKEMGVVEIFDQAPTPEEATAVIEGIARRGVDMIGIDPRRVVYVFSACGGAGGSTVAMTFSTHFARLGRRTLHVDLDLATAPASLFFGADKGARETTGLIDALSNPDRIDALFLERTIQPAGKNLYYLSARRRFEDLGMTGEAVPHLISRAQSNFDMVVVDTPWRAYPDPNFLTVFGPSYVVAPATPAGLLGFSVLTREITGSASKSPVYGVLNRSGEYGQNDVPQGAFSVDFQGEMLQLPYDGLSVGKLFFEQKTLLESGKRLRRPLEKLLGTLPKGELEPAVKSGRRLRRGFVAIGQKQDGQRQAERTGMAGDAWPGERDVQSLSPAAPAGRRRWFGGRSAR